MPVFQYPLELRFKLIALAPRISVTDASGQEQLFVNQKILNLREDVRIYNNSSKETEVFRMKADRIIDFSATYRFTKSATESPLGAVKRKGMRSIWRATYFSDDAGGTSTHHIKEDNPWVKVGDALLGEVPGLNFFTGYFLNPSYTVYRGENREDESQPVMHLVKQPAFWESKYEVTLADQSIQEDEEMRILLSLLMTVQLERRRG
jgi:uncharacterized protein YxjI